MAGRPTIIGGGVTWADGTWIVATSGGPVESDALVVTAGLGAVLGAPGLYTGVGWRGTGYKFAPWVGRVLAQLALQQGTVYDIGRFTPARFAAAEAPEGVAS